MLQPDLFHSLDSPVLSVTQLNHYLRQLLESDDLLQQVWIKGEVSNVSQPRSGHVYFTLKDNDASLACVIWRSQAERMAVLPQNGIAIEARGSISVYEQGGRYQLYVDKVRIAGEGLLFQKFMELKNKLEFEGLFSAERKKPIPALPQTIGIVTSTTGAAIQDMINTLTQRYPLAQVVIAPAAVQGEAAPAEIIRAIHALNKQIIPDVILIGRGGGSLEDLWCFNDEMVVRAIADSPAPTITGIGHETDFTLSDFAADLRAPTPTGAAVLATPDIRDLQYQLRSQNDYLMSIYSAQLEDARARYRELNRHLTFVSPQHRLQSEIQHCDDLDRRCTAAIHQIYRHTRVQYLAASSRLQTLNPSNILARGYALVQKVDGTLVKSITQVQPQTDVTVIVNDGSFSANVSTIRNETGND